VLEPDGGKLAKSRRSIALDPARAPSLLVAALQLLSQPIPPGIEFESAVSILNYSIRNWNPRAFFGTRSVSAPSPS
jgi:hypothetical protein